MKHQTTVKKNLGGWTWYCRCGKRQRWANPESAHYGAWRHVELEARKAAAA
jgi:hypothetical protein